MKESSKISNDNELYLKIDFQIQKLFSKKTKVTNNTTLAQIEKNILSKFKIDTKLKEKISLLKLHGLDPKPEDRSKQIGSIYNPKITVIMDQIINLMVEDDYTYSFLNKTKVEDNSNHITEIPYSNIIIHEGNQENMSYCVSRKCKYMDKIVSLKEPFDKNIHSKSCVLNEINILSELRHPNIPKFIGKVYNPYTYNFGLLCKFINGKNLESLILDTYSLKEEDKWVILLKIAEMIEYLHNLKICYNNLSPSNIIVKDKGKIYLTDFSLANFFNMRNQQQTNNQSNTSKNKAFTMYSAPEVIYKTYYDPAIDIWSFGALVYFLFTGSHPWKNNFYEASEDIFHRKLFDISRVLDLEARNLIILCCNYDSSLRPTAGVIRMNLSFHISNFMKNGVLLNKYFSHSKFTNKIENVFNLDSLKLYKENLYELSPYINERNSSENNNQRYETTIVNEETVTKGKRPEASKIQERIDIINSKSVDQGNL